MTAAVAQTPAATDSPHKVLNKIALTEKAGQRLAESIRKAEDAGMELIKEQPEGKVVSMSREARASTVVRTPQGTVPEVKYLANLISEIVEGTDGNLYIKNPFTYYRTGTYIKAVKGEGNQYIVHTPQLVIEQQNGAKYYLGKICINDVAEYEDSQFGDPTAEEGNDIVFTYEDGVLSEVTHKVWTFDNGGQRMQIDASPILALVTSNYSANGYSASWTGYGDHNIIMEPVNDEVNVLPEEATAETFEVTYLYKDIEAKGFVKVAFDGNDVYLNAFSDYMEDGWAKGTVEGNKVVFRGAQYLGPYFSAPEREQYAHIYFVPCKHADAANADDDFDVADELVFDYDAETRTLTATDAFAINAGKKTINEFIIYDEPKLYPYIEVLTELTSPVILEDDTAPVSDAVYLDENGNGLGSFTFELSDKDLSGNLLNTSNLSFTLYKNDVPMVVTPELFVGVPESFVGGTNIPFIAFTSGDDFYFDFKTGAYFFLDTPKTMSVRMNYVDTDGQVHHSLRNGYDFVERKVLVDMGEPSENPDGIDTLPSSSGAQGAVFDLAGRRVSGMQKGLNLVVENGQVRKIIK